MQKLAQLQKSPQRHRGENTVPSTFPERHKRADGNPGDGTDEFLDKLEVVIAEHDELVKRQLGHLGIEA